MDQNCGCEDLCFENVDEYNIIVYNNNREFENTMRRTQHTYSQKTKNSAQINLLQDKLFSKLEKLSSQNTPYSRYDDLDHKLLNQTPDALTDLIYRAKGITFDNQEKITRAKKQLRTSKKELSSGTFLTGTGLYLSEEPLQQKPVSAPLQSQIEEDADSMLRDMIKRNEEDDLAELRRMIKLTDQNLGGYSRQVHQIKKEVINAANHFKCENQMDYDLTYKLNKINGGESFGSKKNVGSSKAVGSIGNSRKSGSVTKIKDGYLA